MRVLLTRPQREGQRLAEELRRRGFEPLLASLFAIAPLPVPADLEPRLRAAQAILLTSTNGATALAAATALRSRPVYAVGQATAATAEGLGFATVFSADGNAEALAAMVARLLKPGEGPLLHASGSDVAIDLGSLLSARGFQVDRVELYAAQALASLPENARVGLATSTIDVVTLFSPRAAVTFADLVIKAGLDDRLHNVAVLAISDAALQPAAGLGWRQVKVAASPTRAAMISALEELLPARKGDGKEADMSDAAKPEATIAVANPPPVPGAKAATRPAAARSPAAPRRGLGVVGSFISGLIAAVIVLAGALAVSHYRPDLLPTFLGQSPPAPTGVAADAVKAAIASAQSELRQTLEPRLAAIERRQDEFGRATSDLQARLAALPTTANAGDIAALRSAHETAMRDLQGMQALISQLQTQASALDNRLRQSGGPGAAGMSGEELAGLRQRLDKLEAEAQGLTRAVGAASDSAGHAADRDAVDRELKGVRAELEKQALAQRDAVQQGERRIEAAEAEMKQKLEQIAAARADADRRAGDSARAAAAIALSARLRLQVESGAPFARDLELLKPLAAQDSRFGEINTALQPLAASGAPSLAVLRQEFPATAKAALAADLADDSVGERMLAALKRLVSVRRVGSDVAGETVEAYLARAEAALEAGDVARSVALVRKLQGEPAQAAAAWLKRAEAHVAAAAALDRLALLGVGLLAPAQ